MSSAAVHETETLAEGAARELNSDLQFVADRLPVEVKHADAGEVFTLCSTEMGIIWASYIGARRSKSQAAIMDFIVRVGITVNSHGADSGYAKDFGLTYQTINEEGPLIDLSPLSAADLERYPQSLGELAFTAESLRQAFTRQRLGEFEATEEVAQLDAYRAA